MANVHKITARYTGGLVGLCKVLDGLATNATFVDDEWTYGPIRCDATEDEGVVLEIRGVAPDGPPLEFLSSLAGCGVTVSVKAVEPSNVWFQKWNYLDGGWVIDDCREGFFPDEEPDGQEIIYVDRGVVVREPLPDWVHAE